jgi:hypothetical protein
MHFLSDKVRAAVMAFVTNIITALVLFEIVSWSAEQVAVATAIVNSGLIMLALAIPSTTGTSTTISSPSDVDAVTVTRTGPSDGDN